ncbi:MAG: zf-HC2 domain-containing protein [Candidatus Omnitrophota bacterium]
MRPVCHSIRKQLLFFVETRLGKTGVLEEKQQREIEAHTAECEACRLEAERIAAHLNFLQTLLPPTVPALLAAKCLAAAERTSRKPYRRFSLVTAGAAAAILLAVFAAGLWIGNGMKNYSPAPNAFASLVKVQNGLLDQLETLLRKEGDAESQDSFAAWQYPIEQVRYSSQVIEAYYKQNQGNPVAQRGFCEAIYQNIRTLAGLCASLENEKESAPSGAGLGTAKKKDIEI